MLKKPVNVKWQMIFSVIPFLDLYASYRIQKLRLWILIFWVAGSIVGIGYNYAIYGQDVFDTEKTSDIFAGPMSIALYVFFVISFALVQLIVMRKWSISWNNSLKGQQEIIG